jgi:hypothetical protein
MPRLLERKVLLGRDLLGGQRISISSFVTDISHDCLRGLESFAPALHPFGMDYSIASGSI